MIRLYLYVPHPANSLPFSKRALQREDDEKIGIIPYNNTLACHILHSLTTLLTISTHCMEKTGIKQAASEMLVGIQNGNMLIPHG